MKSNINHLPLRTWPSIQSYWEQGNIYGFKIPNYPKASPEIHIKDGWRDSIIPEYDPATHRIGKEIYDEAKDVVTREVIPITEEEFKARAESEKQAKQAQLLEEKKTEQALSSFQTITDEAEALAVKEVYPNWSLEGDYAKRPAGYKVTRTLKGSEGYEVRLFALIQPHTPQVGWEPENTPALWSEIKMQGEVEVWNQPMGNGKYPYLNPSTNQPYEVSHKAQIWVNTHQTGLNVWEPGVQGTEALWKIKT